MNQMTDRSINEINGINLLFPVLNEHLRLEKGITKAVEYLKSNVSIPYQLTILDNGSDDDTPQIGTELSEKYPEVFYVRVGERGVGVAFRKGIELNQMDIVGYMDIDLSTDISYLKRTIDLFSAYPNLQYVNGSRFSDQSDTRGRKWYRKITSQGLLIILKSTLKMHSTDAICGFTFMRKETASQLVEKSSNDNGWFYMIEVLLRAERMGITIYDMPVKWQEDYDTTVKIFKTIKNYLVQIHRLRKAFRRESLPPISPSAYHSFSPDLKREAGTQELKN